jgi:hypothetical protein
MSEQLLLSAVFVDHVHMYHACTAPGATIFVYLLLSFWLQWRGTSLPAPVEVAAPNVTGEIGPMLNSAPPHWEVCGHSHVAPSLPRMKNPRCPLNRKFDGSQTGLSVFTHQGIQIRLLPSQPGAPNPYTKRSSFCINTIAFHLLISDTTSDRPTIEAYHFH